MQRALSGGGFLVFALLLGSQAPAQGSSYFKIGEGCPGPLGTPTLAAEASAVPTIGETFSIEITDVPDGSAIGILGLSTNNWGPLALPIELNAFLMPECWLFTDLRRARPLSIVGGSAMWDTQLPTGPEWIGHSFYQQVIVLDADQLGAGAVISHAMEGVIAAPQPAPFADIVFPPPMSLTDRDSILVRGHAYDPDGVADVLVNGHKATSSDDFANWQVRVPLTTGANKLVVETWDRLGKWDPRAALRLIESQSVLVHPRDIAIDRSRNLAVIIDTSPASLSGMDLSTGKTWLISDWIKGEGPELNYPRCVALDGERALVGDSPGSPTSIRGVIAIDVNTGDRNELSGPNRGTGPELSTPYDIAVDGDRALVIDAYKEKIFAIDLATGNREIFSGENHGAGHWPVRFESIVLDPERNRAFVAVSDPFHAIIIVDLATGDRVRFSDWNTGTGVSFTWIESMALDLPRNRVLALDSADRIIAVDMSTGDRTIFSDEEHGDGPPLIEDPEGIVVDGPRALAVAKTPWGYRERDISGRVVAIDLVSGDRTNLEDPRAGPGPRMNVPYAPAQTRTHSLIIESRWNAIFSIDRATGERRVLSRKGAGEGILLSDLWAIASQRELILATWSGRVSGDYYPKGALLAVDQASGDREVFTGLDIGTGPEFRRPNGLALSIERDLALVLEPRGYGTNGPAIFAVELSSRNRRLISRYDRGSGPALLRPYHIALYGDSAVVLDWERIGIMKVDLMTGDRSILSNPSAGSGPIWTNPYGLAIHEDRILIGEHFEDHIFAVDPVTGDRTIAYDASTGSGPMPYNFGGISVTGDLAALPSPRRNAVIQLDLITGERVIMAR